MQVFYGDFGWAYSPAWIGYAVGLLLWGTYRQRRSPRYASLAILLVALAKVFLIDMCGDTDTHRIKLLRSLEKQVDDILDPARALGFAEIEPSDYQTLVVEYLLSDAWRRDDELKIREAEDALTEVLGWTGLGLCEGETITDTAVEFTCRVLDSDLAKTRIAEQMADTEFADYSRIYSE